MLKKNSLDPFDTFSCFLLKLFFCRKANIHTPTSPLFYVTHLTCKRRNRNGPVFK